MSGLRYVAMTGCLGTGFLEGSLENATSVKTSFIGCDAGSTDGGPHQLGVEAPLYGDDSIKRDLRLGIRRARGLRVPLLVGSANGGGTDNGVDNVARIVREVAKEENLNFRMARLYTEVDRELMIDRYRQGRVHALIGAPEITEKTFTDSAHIVGMTGGEPWLAALDQGADVVIAGRASDASIYAAIPEREGYPRGLVWHAAKISECGSAAVADPRGPDSLTCTLEEDHFVVEPGNPELHCTPHSVALHNLYETANPFQLREAPGTTDTTDATFEALDDRRVKVSGSKFVEEMYTIKLEGAEFVGYRSIVMAAVRDPVVLRQLDTWIEGVKVDTAEHIERTLGHQEYQLRIRTYGSNGTLGPIESRPFEGHESFLIIDAVASSQDLATTVALITNQILSHHRLRSGWRQGISTYVAYPFSPMVTERGPVYRFSLHHAVEVEDPMELFRIETEEVGASA
ncbi:MAG: acyclic terpene utilization AtuA family protein [Acidimicrobiales bacterium]